MRTAILLCGVAAAGAAHAAPWTSEINEHGLRRASVEGVVAFRDREVPAKLTLQCRPGTDGTVSWELEVSDASELSGFAFDDYEGPDAAAASRRLSELAPKGGMLRYTLRGAAAGYYGANAGSFVFSIAAPANAASEAALLAETVTDTTEGYTWTVSPTREDEQGLVATFGAEGARRALSDAMLGCGPVPELDDATVANWQGRNPAAVDLWRQRAIAWRLSGLLGNDYPALVERMASSQPLAREGDVFYVLASDPDDPRHATVVLLGAEGRTEVVYVEAGEIRRVASHATPIEAPAAVREFIAETSR